MGINPPLPTRTLGAAKRLREIGTDAERALWFHLRAGRLCGYKFRRQHPHPSLCRRFLLPRIETGRGIRRIQHTSARDEARTKTLKHHGLTVLRFWDNQVLKEMDSVLQAILDIAQARTLTPALRARRYAPPLPKGEGL